MQHTITRRIRQRTHGRIQRLEVEVNGDTVTVRGRCPSYYIKQLALEGVLEVFAADDRMKIQHKIEVADSPASCVDEKAASPESTNELPPPYVPLPNPPNTVRLPRGGRYASGICKKRGAEDLRLVQMQYADAAR